VKRKNKKKPWVIEMKEPTNFYFNIANNSDSIKKFIADNNFNVINNIKITAIKTRYVNFDGELVEENIVVDKKFFEDMKGINNEEIIEKIPIETYNLEEKLDKTIIINNTTIEPTTTVKEHVEQLMSELPKETIAQKLKRKLNQFKK
jgi:hypothetical protein